MSKISNVVAFCRLQAPIVSEDVQMAAVALGNVYAYKIPYGVQEIRNNGKSVLVEGFDALILEGDILIIGRTNKSPVSSAPVQNDTEEPIHIGVFVAHIHEKYVVLNAFIDMAHNGSLAVEGYEYEERFIIRHSLVYVFLGGIFYYIHRNDLLSEPAFDFDDGTDDLHAVHFFKLENSRGIVRIDRAESYTGIFYINELDEPVFSVDIYDSVAFLVKHFLFADEDKVLLVELRLHAVTFDFQPEVLIAVL